MNKWRKLRRQNLGVIPTESSSNLQAPEVAPSRQTKKVNIRTRPLNFKVSEKFYWELKGLALKKKEINGRNHWKKFRMLSTALFEDWSF